MTVALSPLFVGYQILNHSGLPNAGGFIYVYQAGTSTPATTYTDSSGTIANTNPIQLDAAGYIPDQIWVDSGSSYKFVVESATGTVLGTYDNIPGWSALNIGFSVSATSPAGTVARALVDRGICVTDAPFNADPTGVADSTAALQAAVNAAIAAKCRLYVSKGSYLVSGVITASSPVWISGAGKYVTTIKTAQANASIFSFSGQSCELTDMTLQGPVAPTSGALITTSCISEVLSRLRLSNYYYGIVGSGTTGDWNGVDLNVAATTSSVGAQINGYAGGLCIDKMIGFVPIVTPAAGIEVLSCGALQISNCNIIKQGTNLLLVPGSGQTVASVMAVNTYFDSAQNFNVHIAPQAGGTVVRTYLTQCETSSSSGRGIVIDGSAGTVDGVCIISPQANLCASDGIYIIGTTAKNIDIVGGQCGQNGGSGISIVGSAQNVNVVGTRTGSGYGLTGNIEGIYIDSTCSGVKLTGVIAEGNSGAQIADNANSNIIGCVGASDTTYSNFGNGLVMQSGVFTSSATAGAAVAVTFPKPYPNGVIAVLPAANSASSTTAAAWFDTPTTTGFNGHCSVATTGVAYIAIGY